MRSKASRWIFFVFVFSVWIFQATTLGISDDEAYYWVLSRTPSLGYVYHPPLVAWLIRLFDILLNWTHLPRELLMRTPGILIASLTLWLAYDWVTRTRGRDGNSISWLIVPGLGAMTWMMVPDHSLLLGWMICFRATWSICESDSQLQGSDLLLLALGASIGLLSKFSAVLYCFSAALCLVIFSPRWRFQAIVALLMGMIAAAAPILIWNAQNEWVAILYQFKSRHAGAAWEPRRWATFWASQLLFAGPFLLVAGAKLAWRAARFRLRQIDIFTALWALPASIFLIQPAFSAFKPHWALVFWLPVGLWAALQSYPRLHRLHLSFTLALIAASVAFTQLPLSSMITQWWSGHPGNPLWDVSNDLNGWRELPRWLDQNHLAADLPVTGSRYQTAAQAAFAVWPNRSGTLIPATSAESREWPQLAGVFADSPPGSWPELLRPVLYVQDDRYIQEPQFRSAACERRGFIDTPRFGISSKRIHLWLCQPR